MKRLIVAIIIVSVLIVSSILILITIYDVKSEITTRIDDIIVTAENGNYSDAHSKSISLNEYWDIVEAELVRYVRHCQLDEISSAMAKLPSLIKYEEYGEFFSELELIKAIIGRVWESEVPTLNNIF